MLAEFGDLHVAAGHGWILAPVCLGWRGGGATAVFGLQPVPLSALEMLTSCFGLGGMESESWPLITGH